MKDEVVEIQDRVRVSVSVGWLTSSPKTSNDNNSNDYKTKTRLVAFANFYGVKTPTSAPWSISSPQNP